MFKIILNDEYNTFLPTLGIFAQSWNFLLRYLGIFENTRWQHCLPPVRPDTTDLLRGLRENFRDEPTVAEFLL